ncbi:Alpha/beta hydrolase fold-1 [Thermoascus aurantiacus ATCC 26904]
MPESKPTLVFVHGAFHGPECFKPLVQLLKDAGYPCVGDFGLPGTGNSSTAGLEEDAEALRSVVLKVLGGGNNCLVVVHSYGGLPAIQGLGGLGKKDRGDQPAVLKIVYLSACIPKKGESQKQQEFTFLEANNIERRDLHDLLNIKDGVGTFIGEDDFFYNDLPEETKKELYSKLKTQSMKTLFTPLTYTAYEEIPGWYLVATKDLALSPKFQKYMLRNAGDMMEVVEEIDAGHSSFISQPEKVADFIMRAATCGGDA